jgi:hypothetical protein
MITVLKLMTAALESGHLKDKSGSIFHASPVLVSPLVGFPCQKLLEQVSIPCKGTIFSYTFFRWAFTVFLHPHQPYSPSTRLCETSTKEIRLSSKDGHPMKGGAERATENNTQEGVYLLTFANHSSSSATKMW